MRHALLERSAPKLVLALVLSATIAAAPVPSPASASADLAPVEASGSVQAQQADDELQRVFFETTVEVVQLQVSVGDSQGDFVSGLTADDFSLEVEGRDRDIVAVYEVDLREELTGDEEVFIPPAGWRQFLLFFDLSYTTTQGILRARDAAGVFVREHIHPRDLIGVATYSNISGLQLITPFTADRGQVLDAVLRLGLSDSGRIVDPVGFQIQPLATDVETLANALASGDLDGRASGPLPTVLESLRATLNEARRNDFRAYREMVVGYVDQLEALGKMMQATRGRKHVVLFSGGFDDRVLTGQSLDELAADSQALQDMRSIEISSEERFGSTAVRDALSEALDEFRAADAVVHAFDTSGIGTAAANDEFSRRGGGRQGLNYLADGTSGTATWNANDLTPAMGELAEATSAYYVIAYRREARDPDVVDLEVDVSRAGVQIVSAPTRLAPPPAFADMDEAQRQFQLAEFVTKGIEQRDLNFDVGATAFWGPNDVSRVAVVVEVPWAQLEDVADARGDGKVEFDMLGYVLDDSGVMWDVFSQRINLDIDQMSRGRMAGLPFRYYDLMWSRAGDFDVRVLIRDAKIGRISTRTIDTPVPAFSAGGLAVSGPVYVDFQHPGLVMRGLDPASPPEHRADGPVAYPFVLGDFEVTPMVAQRVAPGESCQFFLLAHNLARHPFTGQVQTSVQVALADIGGSSTPIGNVRLVSNFVDTTSNGTALLMEVTVPTGVRPGYYDLEIRVIDAAAGREDVRRLPVVIGASND